MTVSNVINGTGKVGAEARQRVREAIAQTGYVPNIEARRLAGASGTRIALLYPDTRTPFLTEVLLATLNAANARGTQLLVRDTAGVLTADAETLVAQALAGGAEALVLVPPFAECLADSPVFGRLGIPAVALAAAGPLNQMHTVRIDNRKAADQLTSHLIELGHRQIGFITGPAGHGDSGQRLRGHQDAMARAGLPVRKPHVIAGDFTFQAGCAATARMLAGTPRPTAIVASNDDMAMGAQWAAQQAGLRLPGALSVAGFDDTAAARRAWPALTVMQQPIAQMASTAVDLLLDALTCAAMPSWREVIHPHALVTRDSTSALQATRTRR